VTAAVNVLRVLHVNDLRVLQSAVDALLVQMQEYTSDPKTDSRLGRVGSG
jgi:RLL motif-containing protein 1